MEYYPGRCAGRFRPPSGRSCDSGSAPEHQAPLNSLCLPNLHLIFDAALPSSMHFRRSSCKTASASSCRFRRITVSKKGGLEQFKLELFYIEHMLPALSLPVNCVHIIVTNASRAELPPAEYEPAPPGTALHAVSRSCTMDTCVFTATGHSLNVSLIHCCREHKPDRGRTDIQPLQNKI